MGFVPTFGYSVGFHAPAGVGWPDHNGVLSSQVGGSQWSKSTERCGEDVSINPDFAKDSCCLPYLPHWYILVF